MEDGLSFPYCPGSPGHDIGPDEDRPGFMGVEAILGSPNYLSGEPHYSTVFVPQPGEEPFDENAEAEAGPESERDYRKYFLEGERLKTYKDWKDAYFVNPVDLARNGFIHIGPKDRVQCVFCTRNINEWEENDVVEKEHKRIYPNCPFVQGKCQDVNVPISGVENMMQHLHIHQKGIDAKFPAFIDEKVRLASFINWPPTIHGIPTPEALAEAGFFYNPSKGKNDRVRCFMCGTMLINWQPNDDAWVQHYTKSMHCKFVLERRRLQDCLNKADPLMVPVSQMEVPEESEEERKMPTASASNPEDDLWNNIAVQAVLQDFGNEFSNEQVITAFRELRLIYGPEKNITSELLVKKIWCDERQLLGASNDFNDEEVLSEDMIMLEDNVT